jgi:hypothetical protein
MENFTCGLPEASDCGKFLFTYNIDHSTHFSTLISSITLYNYDGQNCQIRAEFSMIVSRISERLIFSTMENYFKKLKKIRTISSNSAFFGKNSPSNFSRVFDLKKRIPYLYKSGRLTPDTILIS